MATTASKMLVGTAALFACLTHSLASAKEPALDPSELLLTVNSTANITVACETVAGTTKAEDSGLSRGVAFTVDNPEYLESFSMDLLSRYDDTADLTFFVLEGDATGASWAPLWSQTRTETFGARGLVDSGDVGLNLQPGRTYAAGIGWRANDVVRYFYTLNQAPRPFTRVPGTVRGGFQGDGPNPVTGETSISTRTYGMELCFGEPPVDEPCECEDGTDGLNCWDLDDDGVMDPEEDVNTDGVWDALDCRGPKGEDGTVDLTEHSIFNGLSLEQGLIEQDAYLKVAYLDPGSGNLRLAYDDCETFQDYILGIYIGNGQLQLAGTVGNMQGLTPGKAYYLSSDSSHPIGTIVEYRDAGFCNSVDVRAKARFIGVANGTDTLVIAPRVVTLTSDGSLGRVNSNINLVVHPSPTGIPTYPVRGSGLPMIDGWIGSSNMFSDHFRCGEFGAFFTPPSGFSYFDIPLNGEERRLLTEETFVVEFGGRGNHGVRYHMVALDAQGNELHRHMFAPTDCNIVQKSSLLVSDPNTTTLRIQASGVELATQGSFREVTVKMVK
ncbi:MAG: hypothetical protein RLY93_20365 [Sumerlaeia bacterium]